MRLLVTWVLVCWLASGGDADVNAAGAGFANELSNMNFNQIIGGPMSAIVQAQIMSAKATTDFIQAIGFETDESGNSKVINILFQYNQTVNGSLVTKAMEVPFLYLVPIPFIEVNHLTLDFSVKLNSVASEQTSNSLSVAVSVTGGANWGVASVSMTASVAVQSSTKTSATVKRDFSLAVHVDGGSAEMPGGMSRILSLFETIIRQDILVGS